MFIALGLLGVDANRTSLRDSRARWRLWVGAASASFNRSNELPRTFLTLEQGHAAALTTTSVICTRLPDFWAVCWRQFSETKIRIRFRYLHTLIHFDKSGVVMRQRTWRFDTA
jgi:hypothetical protein